MVKRPVTFLEETVFQHVTIHKLMIYIYNKIQISQDPLLAVIRTNILELKKMARCDPLVLIASSKTVLKTLLNFTRLSCISSETLNFIKRLMHDVYARMRKLWEMYKTYGAYEAPKKIKYSQRMLGKENMELRIRKQEPKWKTRSEKKRLLENCKNISNTGSELYMTKSSDKNEMDIASQIRESVANEIGTDGSFDKSSLLERIKSIFTDSSEKFTQEIDNVDTPSSHNSEASFQLQSRSPKKRKVKKWSMGIFQPKKRKRTSNSRKRIKLVNENKSDVDDDTEETLSKLSENNSIEPSVTKSEIVKELSTKFDNLKKKDFQRGESLIDKYGYSIAMDPAWGQRLKSQREFYLNEMTKAVHRLNASKSNLPRYNFLDRLTNKLNVCVTSYGYSLKELTTMDHSSLVMPYVIPYSLTANDRICMKMDSSTDTAILGTLKAVRIKKRFFYECNSPGCVTRTSQLSVLYHHVRKCHEQFNWDWTCSYCGTVKKIDYLKPAKLLDMAMYHFTAYHSTAALKRNPVELEFTEMEIQESADVSLKSSSKLPTKDINTSYYCSLLYKCANCKFSSRLVSEALDHYANEFKESKILKCIYCSENQPSPYKLCEHLEEYHASSIYMCPLCHYRSVSSSNTAHHYFDEHVNEENEENSTKEIVIYVNEAPPPTFGKPKPSPSYYDSSQLLNYFCVHPDGEKFETLIGLKFVQHITSCPSQGGKRNNGSGKKFGCPTCALRVSNAYKLKQHFECHMVLRYNCIYCGFGTSKLSTVKEHLYKFHMYWPPRFIIREDYENCPEDIILQYSSLMKYGTYLEALVEVSVEMDENDIVNSRIKLQAVQPFDGRSEKKSAVFYKTDPGTSKSPSLGLSEENLSTLSVAEQSNDPVIERKDIIEIVSDSEEINNSLDDPIKLPQSHNGDLFMSTSLVSGSYTTTSPTKRMHCPFCNSTVANGSALSRHISKSHNQLNSQSNNNATLINQEGKCFKCTKCDTAFEAFAFLHKHVTEEHPSDTYGSFSIFLEGIPFYRKNIKICFLCSTLIVSLEELYKHPDNCPFAHTTGTPLTSSIVYATGKQACFDYLKGEVKVNKSIVELLQPHQPTTIQNEEVPIVKRAVAKKSTGPRPLIPDSTNSEQLISNASIVKRAVAKKSTGPYIVPTSSNSL